MDGLPCSSRGDHCQLVFSTLHEGWAVSLCRREEKGVALPEFREDGWLPEGHHAVTWEEVEI
jgi:hypothetical protein